MFDPFIEFLVLWNRLIVIICTMYCYSDLLMLVLLLLCLLFPRLQITRTLAYTTNVKFIEILLKLCICNPKKEYYNTHSINRKDNNNLFVEYFECHFNDMLAIHKSYENRLEAYTIFIFQVQW